MTAGEQSGFAAHRRPVHAMVRRGVMRGFDFSPHLCVGFLFLVVRSRLPPPPSTASFAPNLYILLTHNLLTHNLLTYNLLTHNLLTYNLLTLTQLVHAQPTHTHTQLTHIQLAHTQLAHTQLAHTHLVHTQLVHTQLTHTHNLLTHTQNLLTHTTYSHGDIDLHFAWQAWHLWHWAASGGTLVSQWTPLSPRLLAWQA